MNRDIMNRFSQNPVNIDIQRSSFNRNHTVKFSGNVGDLIPFEVTEILPGDTFSVDTSKVIRMQPFVTPVMDNLYCDTYWFFVPNRLVWSHWEAFNGETENSPWLNPVTYTVPKVTIPSGGFDVGTIADYMGIPPKMAAGKTINALPFRAYAKICRDWFYDQNLQTPPNVPTDDTTVTGVNTGDQVTDLCKGGKPFVVAKYHDYFTSCLPAPQRSSATQVQFGLNGLLPVYSSTHYNFGTSGTAPSNLAPQYFATLQSGTLGSVTNSQNLGIGGNGQLVETSSPSISGFTPVVFRNLVADLNNTQLFDINELRQAFAIQRFFEKQARGGSRYIEQIKSFFGVTSPDARLQRAEYLGGSRLPINISEVTQTSATQTGLTPQGNVTGMSATGDSSSDWTKSFTEHGFVLGVMCLRYMHSYQQGIERFWSRSNLFDYYNPTFANLGEQAVLTKEIYADANNDTVFGYQEAWADYRYKPSRIAGELRSMATTPLDMWHFADNYNAAPTLSASWIREDKSNVDRALAVTSSVSNQFWADFYIEARAVRPMPLYSVPGLIDHH